MATTHTFILNGTEVSVECEDDVRLLWVLRDLLGVTGPKYGCGLSVCQACTSHINGTVFNPCAVPVGDLEPTDEVLTIEGLADTADGDLHPVQEVWLEHDVAQCGFCQPGQIMAAVGLIEGALDDGRPITDDDFDALRNVCRCGTYPRVRAAIRTAYERMAQQRSLAPAAARVEAKSAGDPVTFSLPATGGASLLAPAAAAAGTAVAIRLASGRGSAGAVPDQADAGEAERRDPDG